MSRWFNAALARLGLEQYFDAVVTSQDLGVSKPDPLAFREAMRRTSVDSGEAVMVGNDLDRDVQPAQALGLARDPGPGQPVLRPTTCHNGAYRPDLGRRAGHDPVYGCRRPREG